jgi:hypothetical protein
VQRLTLTSLSSTGEAGKTVVRRLAVAATPRKGSR